MEKVDLLDLRDGFSMVKVGFLDLKSGFSMVKADFLDLRCLLHKNYDTKR